MLEADELALDNPSLTIAAAYPGLAGGLSAGLQALDLRTARASAQWHEIVDILVPIAVANSARPFVTLVPSLAAWASLDVSDSSTVEALGIVRLSVRSCNVLMRNGRATWLDVGHESPSTVAGLPNAGVMVVRDTTRLAIELGAAALLGLAPRPSVLPISREAGTRSEILSRAAWIDDRPMQLLATWALTQGGMLTLGDALDRASSSTANVPSDIADALAGLRGLSLRSLVAAAPPSPGALIGELLGELSDAEGDVVRRRVFATVPATLEAVGLELGVTRERVRQIQVRAERRIEEALATEQFLPLHWGAATIRAALGSFAPAAVAQRVMEPFLEGVSPQDELVTSMLLWRLAGSYRLEREACITDAVAAISPSLLLEADEYGIISTDHVRTILRASGVLPQFQDEAIQWLEHFRRLGDSVVVWPRNGVDRLVAMLALRGEPTDIETLVRESGEDYSTRGLYPRLLADARVVRVSRREVGLAAWGLEEYSGITDEIAERIERGGGRARVSEVAAEVAQFGVRESSVRMYAEAPIFVIEGEWVRLRTSDEAAVATDGLADARHTYRLGPASLAYVVEVDHDMLRGSGRGLPRGTSVALGVQPGTRISFAGESGEVTVSWPLTSFTGPSIGSLRSHAVAHDLGKGDLLRLVFDTESSSVVSVGLHKEELNALSADARAALVTGITGLDGSNLAAVLAQATGTHESALRRSLIARGDEDLLALLKEDTGNDELDEALATLARALTGST